MLDGVDVDPFPHLEHWLDTVGRLSATLTAYELAKSYNKNCGVTAVAARKGAYGFRRFKGSA